MRPCWCAVRAVPLSACALHSNVGVHINDQSVRDYHIEINKRARMMNLTELNDEAALA